MSEQKRAIRERAPDFHRPRYGGIKAGNEAGKAGKAGKIERLDAPGAADKE